MANVSADKLKVNLTNSQRTFMWEVIIPDPIGGGDTEALTVRAQSTSIPGREFGKIHIDYKNTAGFNVPGKVKYSQNWTVTFVEGEDRKIRKAITDWMQQIIHDTQMVGLGDPFIKKNVYFRLLSSNGDKINSIKLVGAYPEKIDDTSVDYNTEDVVKYGVTFSFDRWTED